MFLLYCDSKEPDIWTATGPMMYTASNDESMLFATSTMELAEHVQKRFGKGFGTIRAVNIEPPTAEIAQLLVQHRILLLKNETDVELMLESRANFPFEDYAIRRVSSSCA